VFALLFFGFAPSSNSDTKLSQYDCSKVNPRGISMKIKLSGHHVDVTDTVRQHVEEKFSKIASHFPTLIALDIIVAKEHGQFEVEIRTNYEGSRISASSKDNIMYPAIAKAGKKLDAALKHRKGQLKDNLHMKPKCTTPEIAHEIIQGMDLH
jgi:ribosomal subunit interface protein